MNAEVEAYGHVLSYKGEDQHSPRLPTSENFDPTVPSRRPPGPQIRSFIRLQYIYSFYVVISLFTYLIMYIFT